MVYIQFFKILDTFLKRQTNLTSMFSALSVSFNGVDFTASAMAMITVFKSSIFNYYFVFLNRQNI